MSVRHILAAACATAFLSSAAFAAETIKIGFPIPLSGPTAIHVAGLARIGGGVNHAQSMRG